MQTRFLFLILALTACLGLSASAAKAQSSAVRAARDAVETLLERRFDDVGWFRFSREQERPSALQTEVDGSGECRIRGRFQTFRYRATVDRFNRARNVRVEFSNGLVVTDDWSGSGSGQLRILEPREGASVSGSRVRIAGESLDREVHVLVYDRLNNDRVANEYVRVNGGRWSVTVPLGRGSYRVVAEASGRQRDEVRFFVGGDPGFDGDARIVRPRNREEIRSSTIEVDGTSNLRQLRVQLTTRLNTILQEERILVSSSRFRVRFNNVKDGDYKVRLVSAEGRALDEAIVIVRAGWGGSGGSFERIRIDSPRSGSIQPNQRVRFAGRADRDRAVRIEVRRNGRVVASRTVSVRNGRFDEAVPVNGTGRMTAEARGLQSGSRDSVSFEVSGTGGSGGFGGSGGSWR